MRLHLLVLVLLGCQAAARKWPDGEAVLVLGGQDGHSNKLSKIDILAEPDDIPPQCNLPTHLTGEYWVDHASFFYKEQFKHRAMLV